MIENTAPVAIVKNVYAPSTKLYYAAYGLLIAALIVGVIAMKRQSILDAKFVK